MPANQLQNSIRFLTNPEATLLNHIWCGSDVVMRAIFTKMIFFSLLGLGLVSRLNFSEAQQINFNLNKSQTPVTHVSLAFSNSQPTIRIDDYVAPATSLVIVRNRPLYQVTPVNIHLSSYSERRKWNNYEAIVGGAIGFAVGLALGASMYSSDSGVPVGGLILAIPGTIIGVKLTSNKNRAPKRRR